MIILFKLIYKVMIIHNSNQSQPAKTRCLHGGLTDLKKFNDIKQCA